VNGFICCCIPDKGDGKTWKKDMASISSVINAEMNYLKSISDLPLKILHLSSWRKSIQATTSGTIQVVRNFSPFITLCSFNSPPHYLLSLSFSLSLLSKWFNAAPEYILDIPGLQMNVKGGSVADNCGSVGVPDSWNFANGIMSLTYNNMCKLLSFFR
jgi:hypothetical protein